MDDRTRVILNRLVFELNRDGYLSDRDYEDHKTQLKLAKEDNKKDITVN